MLQCRRFSHFKFPNLIALFLVVSSIMLSAIQTQADVFKIPELESRVSEGFVLESIAKLDDFIEELRRKEQLRTKENAGFVVATAAQIGALSSALFDHLVFKTKYFTPAVDELKTMNDAGKAGSISMELKVISRRWMTTSTAGQAASNPKEKVFSVHVKDIPLFRQVLVQVRERQAMILYKIVRDKVKSGLASEDQLSKLSMRIQESRPSFKAIYGSCSANPSSYKMGMMFEIYRLSLFDYFKFLTLSPSWLTAQFNSGLISPTLRSYMNQEVLPRALKKCFNVSDDASGFFSDESERFIAQLLGADAVAKFVVISTVVAFWKFKKSYDSAGVKSVSAANDSRVMKLMKPAIDFFQKIFAKVPAKLIARVLVYTQIVCSSYNLYTIKKEYDEAKDEKGIRRNQAELRMLAKKYFHDRALGQIESLEKLLNQDGITIKDRAALEKEINNWKSIETEFRS
jgi:hypothetical protein